MWVTGTSPIKSEPNFSSSTTPKSGKPEASSISLNKSILLSFTACATSHWICRRLQPSKTSRPTWVSDEDVVLKKQKPGSQTKFFPKAQPLLPHTQANKKDVSAPAALSLVDVSHPWHKKCDIHVVRWHVMSTLQKTHKRMPSQKVFTSRHGFFV